MQRPPLSCSSLLLYSLEFLASLVSSLLGEPSRYTSVAALELSSPPTAPSFTISLLSPSLSSYEVTSQHTKNPTSHSRKVTTAMLYA